MKPRDVQVYPLAIDTTILRSRTWDRLKFEIEYGLQRGTTANSYLIGADKTALIDPPGESFCDIFLSTLQERIELNQIDYVILGHVNPNRVFTLKKLLALAPQLQLVCSNPAAQTLETLFEDERPQLTVIKGEETLDLGKDHALSFIRTPNPRFPGQLCTYDSQTKILFSDKLFGAHVCGDQVLDEGWRVYQEDRRYYFDCLLAPYARQVEKALDKLNAKGINLIAPGHGPQIRYGLHEVISDYRQWITQQNKQSLSVALIYASAYGNTATLAQAIARGITKAGVRVDSINAEIAEPEEIKSAIEQCGGFIFGSPR